MHTYECPIYLKFEYAWSYKWPRLNPEICVCTLLGWCFIYIMFRYINFLFDLFNLFFQYTDEEVERCFEEFYEDVHTEFLKFGEIVNFKVLFRYHVSVCILVLLMKFWKFISQVILALVPWNITKGNQWWFISSYIER